MTTPDVAAVVAALTAERYAGEWWLRRAAETMQPAAEDDQLAGARRRRVLDAETTAHEQAQRQKTG